MLGSIVLHPKTPVNPVHVLHALGQRLWVDNITRSMLDTGTLQRYIDTLQVTGLTSNPTIFDQAIGSDTQYGAAIAGKARCGLSGEALFVELALEDLCRAAAEAYLRGIQRRLDAGLSPQVMSVASVFVSRWDVAVKDKVPQELHNRLGIAVCEQTYQASLHLLASPRWQRQAKAGALPQRVLSASTGTKDPQASDTLYVEALAAPDTINTLPEKTLLAFADHGRPGHVMPLHEAQTQAQLARFAQAGIDIDSLGVQLQQDGAVAFVKSWHALLARIAEKSQALAS